MNMDQAIRDSLNQLVTLQYQQLNTLNDMAMKNTSASSIAAPPPAYNSGQPYNGASNYSNYAPNFMPAMFPVSPYTQEARGQFSGYMRQAAGNYSFSNMLVSNKSMISPEASNLQGTQLGENLVGAGFAGAKTVGGTAADLGLSALGMGAGMGMLGGMAFGAVGGAAVAKVIDIAQDQTQQSLAYNKYLMQNSYKMIDPKSSNNDRGIGGMNLDERFQSAKFLRHLGSQKDINIGDDDTMSLLQKFTEGGLMRNTSDLDQFEKKMTELTKFVKRSALTLNKTVEEVADLMSEMEKSGVSTKNFEYLSSKSKVVGSFVGQDAYKVLTTSANVSNALNGNTTVNNEETIKGTMDKMNLTRSYQNYLEANPNTGRNATYLSYIKNNGGFEQVASQQMSLERSMNSNEVYNQMIASAWDPKTGRVDSGKFNEALGKIGGIKNSGDFSNFVNDTQTTMNSWSIADKLKYKTAMPDAISSMNASDQDALRQTILNAYKSAQGSRMDGLSDEQIDLDFTNNFLQLNGAGAEQWSAQKVWGNTKGKNGLTNSDSMRRTTEALSRRQEMMAQINADNGGGASGAVRRGWESFKDDIGDSVPVKGVMYAAQSFNTWWTGEQYETNKFNETSRWKKEDIDKYGKSVDKAVKDGAYAIVKGGLTSSFLGSTDANKVLRNRDVSLGDMDKEISAGIDQAEREKKNLANWSSFGSTSKYALLAPGAEFTLAQKKENFKDSSDAEAAEYAKLVDKAMSGDKDAQAQLYKTVQDMQKSGKTGKSTYATLNAALSNMYASNRLDPTIKGLRVNLTDVQKAESVIKDLGMMGSQVLYGITGDADEKKDFREKYEGLSTDANGKGDVVKNLLSEGKDKLIDAMDKAVKNHSKSLKFTSDEQSTLAKNKKDGKTDRESYRQIIEQRMTAGEGVADAGESNGAKAGAGLVDATQDLSAAIIDSTKISAATAIKVNELNAKFNASGFGKLNQQFVVPTTG